MEIQPLGCKSVKLKLSVGLFSGLAKVGIREVGIWTRPQYSYQTVTGRSQAAAELTGALNNALNREE